MPLGDMLGRYAGAETKLFLDHLPTYRHSLLSRQHFLTETVGNLSIDWNRLHVLFVPRRVVRIHVTV